MKTSLINGLSYLIYGKNHLEHNNKTGVTSHKVTVLFGMIFSQDLSFVEEW